MKETYEEAITRVFADEGGYSNDAGDPGGPTNWGITIADARMYWKPTATASDVRNMPKTVAEEIYVKHYATPLCYDNLPAGVDYAILDYGVNSGIGRASRVLQKLVGVPIDGIIGSATLAAVDKQDAKQLINRIYDERMAFLRALGTWRLFGKGWTRRCKDGRALALQLADKYPTQPVTPASAVVPAVVVIAAAGTAASAGYSHDIGLWVAAGILLLIGVLFGLYEYRKHTSVQSVLE